MRLILFSAFLVILAGCTSTKLTSTWAAPDAGTHDYKKIMVVSIIQKEDSTMRLQMENTMVNELKQIDHHAVSYLSLFKDHELKNMRYDSVRKRLENFGIDGVITISLMSTEKESVYVADRQPHQQDNRPLGSFWESPSTVRQQIGKPGYYVESKNYYWESNFYDVSTINLVYSAHSQAFEVSSVKSLANKYCKMIIGDLKKSYLLATN